MESMSNSFLLNLVFSLIWLFIAGFFWVLPENGKFRYRDGRKWVIRGYSWFAMLLCILCALAVWY